jgi:flavin reductase (DIM6/NTAB) family NADH-FMN oxidoreductase RutF
MDLELDDLFRDAMAHLASGVAVITARRDEGRPCGLAATALVSYSAHPPSLLVSIWHGSRCHDALAECERFGVHLLRADQIELAHRFADRQAPDKFAGLEWDWDEDVPELARVLAYLRCRRAENFVRYDHTVLIGDLETGRLEEGEPLVYSRRRMDWLMSPMMG